MYEVQAIVGKRINPKTNILEYEVKWVGTPAQQNTWQPEKNLKFVKKMIIQYNQKVQMRGENFVPQNNANPAVTKNQTIQKNNPLQKIVQNDNQNSEGEQMQANIYFQEESQNQNKKSKSDEDQDDKPKEQRKSQNEKQVSKDKKPVQTSQIINKKPKTNKPVSQKRVEHSLIQKMQMNKPMPKQVQQKSITKQILVRQQTQLYKNFNNRREGPPPLPPDFAINKAKYIDPSSHSKSSYSEMPYKHKIIQKQRYRQQKKKVATHFSGLQKGTDFRFRQQNFKDSLQQRNFYRPGSKAIPPPPPFLTQNHHHQPIVQQNYFSNQYQVYSPSIPSPIVQHPKPLKTTYSIPPPAPVPQPKYQYTTTQQHTYSYQNYDYNGLNGNQNNEGFEKQAPFEEEGIQVIKVLNMEKKAEGYSYYVDTNLGEMWLDRSYIVPKFSTALVQFYEQYLTFGAE